MNSSLNTSNEPGVRPVGADVDYELRLRDRYGNRMPWRWSFRGPVLTREDPYDSRLAMVFKAIEDLSPYEGGKVRWNYANLVEMRRVAGLAEDFAWSEVEALNRQSVTSNERLECEADLERAAREIANERHAAETEDVEELILETSLAAIEAVANKGGWFDPTKPGPACLPLPEAPSEEEVGADIGKPLLRDDESVMLGQSEVKAVTVGVGALVGTSIGVTFGAVDFNSLIHHPGPGNLAALAAFAGGGYLVATACGAVVEGASYLASESFCLGKRKSGFLWTSVAVAATAGLCILDATTGQQGLFKGADAEAGFNALGGASADSASHLGPVLASYIVASPYLLMRNFRGIFKGRRTEGYKVLSARRKQHEAATKAFVDTDGYRNAVKAVGKVALLERRKGDLVARADKARTESEAREAELRAAIKPPLFRLTEYGSMLVQDVQDRLSGCLALFTEQLDAAHDAAAKPRWLTVMGRSAARTFRRRSAKVRG